MKKLFSKENILIFLIICLAAFMRLYKISDYLTFLGDEGRDVLIAYNILHGHLTLLGPTASVGGFFLGPIYYYFIAPFLWLFHYDPVGPAVMVALFGVATVWFIYRIGTEFFNRQVGTIAALLYAVSPLVISYSRSSWNPNLMPFFSLLTLYCVYKALLKNKYFLFILSGILFGITMQLHYLTVFLGVIIIVYIAVSNFKIKKTVKDYFYFLLGFVIGWSPFLAFEFRHGFKNMRNIIDFVFNPQGKDAISTNIGFTSTIFNVFFRLFGRLVTNFPSPDQLSMRTNLNVFIWFWATLILGLSSFILFIFYYKKVKNQKEKILQVNLILFWFVIGIVLFGFYRKNIYDYYFGFMFPLPFLLIGNLLFKLYSSSHLKYLGKILAIIVFVGLLFLNLLGIPFLSAPNKQKVQMQEIANFVLQKAGGQEFNFALLTLGNSDFAYRYFFHVAKYDPATILPPEQDPQRKSVAAQLLIVCEDPNCHPLGSSLWEVAGFGRAEIVGEWPVSVVKVYKLIHYQGKN